MNSLSPFLSTSVSPDTFADGSPRLDRRNRFCQLLSQALENEHEGALGTLLEGARSDRDARMIQEVGRHYRQASDSLRRTIDHWLDSLSHQQRLDFGEECDFVDHARGLQESLKKRRNNVLEDILYGTLHAVRDDRYFEEIGRQRAHANGDQKRLIDQWQKVLSHSQRTAYLSGMGELPKLNAVWQQASHFVDDKTLLSLRLSSKYLGHYIGNNHPGRLIAAKAAQFRRLPKDFHAWKLARMLAETKTLSDTRQQMVALEGLARAVHFLVEVGAPEFRVLMDAITALEPELQVRPLTALAPHLAPWRLTLYPDVDQLHAILFDAIRQLPLPAWRLAPLDATIRTAHSQVLRSKHIPQLVDMFVSVDVEDLSHRHLRAWAQLATEFLASGGWLGNKERAVLVKRAQKVIKQLPDIDQQSLFPYLPHAQQ